MFRLRPFKTVPPWPNRARLHLFFTDESPPEANGHFARKDIPGIVCNLKIRYRVHKARHYNLSSSARIIAV